MGMSENGLIRKFSFLIILSLLLFPIADAGIEYNGGGNGGLWDAQIKSINPVPSNMYQGQKYPVSVTVRNSGAVTWDGHNVRLTSFETSSSSFEESAGAYGGEIPPGGEYTFQLTFSPAGKAGDYTIVVRMENIQSGASFGQSKEIHVTVVDSKTPTPTKTPTSTPTRVKTPVTIKTPTRTLRIVSTPVPVQTPTASPSKKITASPTKQPSKQITPILTRPTPTKTPKITPTSSPAKISKKEPATVKKITSSPSKAPIKTPSKSPSKNPGKSSPSKPSKSSSKRNT